MRKKMRNPITRDDAIAAITADPDRRRAILARLLGQAAVWSQAIAVQAQRVHEAPSDIAEREMALFKLALRGLLMSADTVRRLGVDVRGALDAFDAVAPDAEDIRDILTHADEYTIGAGRSQEGDGLPLDIAYSRSATAGTAITTTNPSRSLDVGAAIGATNVLATHLASAIHADGA